MTTTTISQSPTGLASPIQLRQSRVATFGALVLRDLTVLRKNWKEFLPRTILQPLLLVFVFTYVFPKIGQGVGGGANAAAFSSVLVAGVVAIRDLLPGHPGSCAPARTGVRIHARDRGPCPGTTADRRRRMREDRRRRVAVPPRRSDRVPHRRRRARDPGAPRRELAGGAHARPDRVPHERRGRTHVRHDVQPAAACRCCSASS